jgi:hypothetical protein
MYEIFLIFLLQKNNFLINIFSFSIYYDIHEKLYIKIIINNFYIKINVNICTFFILILILISIHCLILEQDNLYFFHA